MNFDIPLLKEQLYHSIYNLSDIEYQKTRWLGKHPTDIFSFTESSSGVYDDAFFEDFIKDEIWNKTGLSHELHEKMLELDKIFRAYLDYVKSFGRDVMWQLKMTDEQILEDPKWIEVTEKAKGVIKLWDKEEKIELTR